VGLAVSLVAASCAPARVPDVEVADAWAWPADAGGTSAVYMRLTNHTAGPDRLLGGASAQAGAVEIHETMMEGDMAHMMPVSSVDLAPGETVDFEPGGRHVMLVNLSQGLAPGDRVSLTLHFEHAGDVQVEAEVRQP
jgi:copper(I)-binding protein